MDSNTVIIVSGLPRSGTSMMMKMLEAGANNRKCNYEYEYVKQTY